MEDNELITDDNIARVKDLLMCMEKGNEEDAIEVIDELTAIRETELYQDMGKLTRELHDAISNFGIDDSINVMAEHDIPDARERLNYVITKQMKQQIKHWNLLKSHFLYAVDYIIRH